MTNHPALAHLVKRSQAGNSDAAEALAFAFTGMICASMPGIDLGFHQRPDPKNFNQLSWISAAGHVLVRVDLIGGSKIAFQVIDSKGIKQVDATFTNIDEMIRVLRIAKTTANEGKNSVKRAAPASRKGRKAKR